MRGENSSSEKISCRICQVRSENLSKSFELIQLGCGCKDGLGTSHHRCTKTWFKSRKNRICEICGKAANNMTGIEDTRLVISWSETTMMPSSTNTSESETSCWSKHGYCHSLLECLLLLFLVAWAIQLALFR